ncbi:hypothetical protein Q31b_05630 [Novipirellula aureliae]|uniref:Uncharacterized protein n=1 Tax=Novipirellula aureliae TaxID=2527966 RepID=A0A5C6EC95_9BACT|nr:hypothetical protein [Novipirellula aureliae]TWU45391.1 hypothetical protein Q31b_05630 [Novipirellula aureliae]
MPSNPFSYRVQRFIVLGSLAAVILVSIPRVSAQTGVSGSNSDGTEQLEEAAIFLEGRLPFANSPQAKSRIQSGIDSLRELVASVADGDDGQMSDVDFKPTTRVFQRYLEGTVAFDEETWELSIVYNFKNSKQLKDFRGDGASVRPGLLIIEAGKKLEHVVEFKEVAVAGTVKLTHDAGELISTSGGLRMETTFGYQQRFVLFLKGASDIAQTQVLSNGRSGTAQPLPFLFKVDGQTVAATLGKRTIGGKIGEPDKPEGAVMIGPYQGPLAISGLRIVGKVDPAWAQTLLENEP